MKIRSMVLSNNINDTEVEARLPDIRSLIRKNLTNLEDLVLCYTNPTEYEDLRAFLSSCQELKRLCLRVRTFKALDGLNFPSLQYLRMEIQYLDKFAVEFFLRHDNINTVNMSYFSYGVLYDETVDSLSVSLKRALTNIQHDVYREDKRQDCKSWGRLN